MESAPQDGHSFGKVAVFSQYDGSNAAPALRRKNETGMPDALKARIESLSNMTMDDVQVYYNSTMPEQFGALAYTQGTKIYVRPGQERHLAHEAWHVVQQKQGRVKPSLQVNDHDINDDQGLETEAAMMGADANYTGRLENSVMPGGKQLGSPGQLRQVIQLYYERTADGKIRWVDGKPPNGYVETGEKKPNGAPIFAAPAVVKANDDRQAQEEEQKRADLEARAAARAHPVTPRRNFTAAERGRLGRIPKVVVREDKALFEETGSTGRRKAHLTEKGLRTAGKATITATEQQDQDSTRKARGNRVSSKVPLPAGQQDASNKYGNQTIQIKAQKLERARLRGKEDAQHVTVKTTPEIHTELDRGPEESDTGKTRDKLKGFAKRDREVHHIVDFRSPEDSENYIPNRFLMRDDMDEIHDSDSELESDEETDDN